MIVIGLDPGTEKTAVVGFDAEGSGRPFTDIPRVIFHFVQTNEHVLEVLHHPGYEWFDDTRYTVLVLEQVESFGMAVGREVFETVFWTGRFAQAWSPRSFARMPRRTVKQHLCHTARATDSNIRQALIDRFGPGQDKAIGTKKAPGPLYGVKGHEMSALAVAVVWYDQHKDDGETIRPGVVAEF